MDKFMISDHTFIARECLCAKHKLICKNCKHSPKNSEFQHILSFGESFNSYSTFVCVRACAFCVFSTIF